VRNEWVIAPSPQQLHTDSALELRSLLIGAPDGEVLRVAEWASR
jgi:hypothetical protein